MYLKAKWLMKILVLGCGMSWVLLCNKQDAWAQGGTTLRVCPNNWVHVVVGSGSSKRFECRPKVPGSMQQMYRSPQHDLYPVCGMGRIPVQNGVPLNKGTSGLPLGVTYTYTGTQFPNQEYKGLVAAPSDPENPDAYVYVYSYANNYYGDCGCAVANLTSPNASGEVLRDAVQYPRFDTLVGGITMNGSQGALWRAGLATCGCPNINMKIVRVDGGYVCQAPPRSSCNTAYDDLYASQIVNPMAEPQRTDNSIITSGRNICICETGLKMNTATGNCEEALVDHKPGVQGMISPVSPRITAANDTERFHKTMNKLLATCLNGFGTQTTAPANPSDGNNKLDCIANGFVKYASFDQLWAATTPADDGGFPYAIQLRNAEGNPITGFYTLKGQRCDEFSEFGGDLVSAKVNPNGVGGYFTKTVAGSDPATAIQTTGKFIPLPGSIGGGVAGYSEMREKIGLPVPTTADQMRRCPILARAAIQVSCPDNDAYPTAAQRPTYEEKVGSTVVRQQCSAASDIKVHMRVEQIYELAGMPVLKAKETIVNGGSSSSVSIQRIIAEKTGGQCPTGMSRVTPSSPCTWTVTP